MTTGNFDLYMYSLQMVTNYSSASTNQIIVDGLYPYMIIFYNLRTHIPHEFRDRQFCTRGGGGGGGGAAYSILPHTLLRVYA